MTMTISTNPQIVMLWQGIILDFSEADSPRVQSAMYLPEMGNNASPKNAVMQTTNPGGKCQPEKGRVLSNFPIPLQKQSF